MYVSAHRIKTYSTGTAMALFGKFTSLASSATSGLLGAATSFAGSVALAAISLGDLRNFFKLIDMVPGIPDRDITPEYATQSLVFIQQGRLTFAINFTQDDGISAQFIRTAPLSVETLKDLATDMDFTMTTLSGSPEDSDPSLNMLINQTLFSTHGNGITGDILAKALLAPIDSVPVVGGIAADALQRPVRGIATFLLDIITDTARGAHNIVRQTISGTPPQTPAP